MPQSNWLNIDKAYADSLQGNTVPNSAGMFHVKAYGRVYNTPVANINAYIKFHYSGLKANGVSEVSWTVG